MLFRGNKKLKIVLAIGLFAVAAGEGSLLFADYMAKRLPNPPKECFSKENEYDKWTCFRPYFEELVRKVSPGYAMTEAKIFKEKEIIDDCHLIAHYVGEATLEKYGFDAGQALASCEFGCIEGCFHGVMERYVRYETDPYSIASKVGNMCDTVSSSNPQKESLLKSQCSHGIGHGLVAHNFLPIDEALVICQSLDNSFNITRCRAGVAMEYIEQYLSLEENNLREVLPEICMSFSNLNDFGAMVDCVHNIGVALMWYTKHDLGLSKNLCAELKETEYVRICKSGAESEEIINLLD